MSPDISAFVSSLHAYSPGTDESPVASLYSLVSPIEKDPTAPEAFPEIFAFFERFPDADLGTPGPLVHLIEQHIGKYEALLVGSVRRAPSTTTIWMINRILNAKRDEGEKRVLTDL